MGQTTANYKPPCAEMSYDLCELGSEREAQKLHFSTSDRCLKYPIQENMSGKSNKERGTKMSPVFNETDSKINLCWLLALTFVPHTLKTKSLKLKLFVNCFSRFLSNVFEQAPLSPPLTLGQKNAPKSRHSSRPHVIQPLFARPCLVLA